MRRGFTIVEALAAVALLGVGIVASLGAISTVRRTEARLRESEIMQRLAIDKYQELVATGQTITPSSGDFTDRNLEGYSWSMGIENSGVTDLTALTVTVEKIGGDESSPRQSITGMVYVPPAGTATP